MGSHAAQVPTSFGRELRVCLRCALMKTYDQVSSFFFFPALCFGRLIKLVQSEYAV